MEKTTLLAALALLLSLLLLPFNSNAARPKNIGILSESSTGSVTSNLGLYGGWVLDIAVDSRSGSNVVYAISRAPNGIHSSTNGGLSWTSLSGASYDLGKGYEVEIDQTNGDVYALFNSSLAKSTDQGQTFNKIGNFGGRGLAFANGILVAANHTKVQISTDKGATFSEKTIDSSSGAEIIHLAASPTAGIFYAVVNSTGTNKLYRSTNKGSSWSDMAVSSNGAGTGFEKVAVNPLDANHVVITNPSDSNQAAAWQTTNGGSTWSAIQNGASDFDEYADGPSFDSTGRLFIGRGWADSPYNSWTTFSPSGLSLSGRATTANANNTQLIYATSNTGVARSTDRGATWVESNEGIVGVETYDISQANDKNIAWAATFSGVAKTTNFRASSPDWEFPILQESYPNAIWVHPTNTNIVIVGGLNGIYRTANGGSSWSLIYTSGKFGVNQLVATDDLTIYAAMGTTEPGINKTGELVKSTDLGLTWTNAGLPSPIPANSVTVGKDGSVYVGVGSTGSSGGGNVVYTGIYKYSGGTWQELTNAPDLEIQSIIADPENANIIYAAAWSKTSSYSPSGFYKSTDAGATWRKITNGLPYLDELTTMAIQTTTSPNTLYLATGIDSASKIYKSSDGGESWGVYYEGLTGEAFHDLVFDGLVGTNNRGVYGLKSKGSIDIASYKRVVQKVKRKGKIKKKVRYLRLKTVKKGALVYLKVSLQDATTKKKLKKRTVLLYKKVIVKKKIKKKVRRVARWKLIKRLKISAKGYVLVRTKFNTSTIFYAKWKPANKNDKEEYTTSKSKTVKVKVKR